MRLTDFWWRMNEHYGPAWAASYARDTVISGLGGRTIEQALAAGDSVKDVWRATCIHDPSIPTSLR
ncbi:MAG TPA: DUF3046 domain-containing protein [Candidatus Nanopelagicaceae bacterium]|nr:DUF3046 domain-containing protein [Candidatus Nanopelagicaceae bacterium]